MPLPTISNFGFGFARSLCREFEVVTKVDDIIVSGNSGELVFDKRSKVDLSVSEDVSPEDRREVRAILLRLEVLEGALDVGEVDILQEVCFPCDG